MSGANAIGLSQMPAKTENNRRTERNVAVSLEQPACLRKWSTRLWRNFRSEWRHALRQVVDTLNILSAWLWYCEYEFGPKKRKFYNTTVIWYVTWREHCWGKGDSMCIVSMLMLKIIFVFIKTHFFYMSFILNLTIRCSERTRYIMVTRMG